MNQSSDGTPLVSILVVARNTAAYIGAALQSAREQTYKALDILVVDDGSTDTTRAVAQAHAVADERVRVLDGPRAGLSAARNTSLAAAQGQWAAILDSDDVLHPRHIERLVQQAHARSAHIVAANMVSFSTNADRLSSWLFADGGAWTQPHRIGLADYVRANSAAGDAVSAGYLKPLFDMAFLRSHAVQYDVRLRIAEDYDLVARLMDRGASFEYLPEPTYFYRRHSSSTSHRHSVKDLSAMLALADNLKVSAQDDALRTAIAARKDGIRAALRHARAIEGPKPATRAASLGLWVPTPPRGRCSRLPVSKARQDAWLSPSPCHRQRRHLRLLSSVILPATPSCWPRSHSWNMMA
ncbi:glycosyl family 2 [Novosphingobium sp. Rr 2-17]|uniref:glycosyltransferase family 2 protein n=1 Tax=Novosphingobium sp. Rr 2-17 TaxID=555793 RepID=UPI0002699EFB|nr:glycosyltransferase family 2 protein [Novosphingobium sp. Rr 2-17]EIZ78459.1 glycosyl family 2 [Novosphingobium sp. Rr 2-17]